MAPKRKREEVSDEDDDSGNEKQAKGRKRQKTTSKKYEGDWEFLKPENRRDVKGRKPSDPDYDATTVYVPNGAVTGMEKQYWELKKYHMDKVVIFKKGKFYELYADDAEIGNRYFGLKFSGNNSGEGRMRNKMVGFPERSLDLFVSKMVHCGFNVVRVEQTETVTQRNKRGKSDVVERKITQILTPATITDESMLYGVQSRYLITIKEDAKSMQYAFVVVDASLAEVYIGTFQDDEFRVMFETLVHQLRPKEVIVERHCCSALTLKILISAGLDKNHILQFESGDKFIDEKQAEEYLNYKQYFRNKETKKDEWPEALTLYKDNPLVMSAVGTTAKYLEDLLIADKVLTLKNFHPYDHLNAKSSCLLLDGQTLLNLELLQGYLGKKGTLYEHLNRCVTNMGARKLEEWLRHPLTNKQDIEDRQNSVKEMGAFPDEREKIQAELSLLPDLQRKIAHIHRLSTAPEAVIFDPQVDTKKLKEYKIVLNGLRRILNLIEFIQSCGFASKFLNEATLKDVVEIDDASISVKHVSQLLTNFETMFDIDQAIKDNTGFITPAKGTYKELDRYIEAHTEVDQKIKAYLVEMKKKLKCSSLTYFQPKQKMEIFFEASDKDKFDIPKDFTKVKGKKGIVRFASSHINSLLPSLIDYQEKRDSFLRGLMKKIFGDFSAFNRLWQKLVTYVATIDCLNSFALVQKSRDSIFPTLSESTEHSPYFAATGLVHPCLTDVSFIPNDVSLGCNANARFFLITGPNMGGKSTIMRQSCLAVIMGQIGCPIFATECHFTIVDKIFTRIGASDKIMSGQSTFMVELHETSNILAKATEDSLVILDELGRGTSTFDGMAIALAVAYSLAERGCRTLFSTHYHLITEELRYYPLISLYHMACNEEGEMVPLYILSPGVCPKSYGMRIANAAGIPVEVVKRAASISQAFEQKSKNLMVSMQRAQQVKPEQRDLFVSLVNYLEQLPTNDEDTAAVQEQLWNFAEQIIGCSKMYK